MVTFLPLLAASALAHSSCHGYDNERFPDRGTDSSVRYSAQSSRLEAALFGQRSHPRQRFRLA